MVNRTYISYIVIIQMVNRLLDAPWEEGLRVHHHSKKDKTYSPEQGHHSFLMQVSACQQIPKDIPKRLTQSCLFVSPVGYLGPKSPPCSLHLCLKSECCYQSEWDDIYSFLCSVSVRKQAAVDGLRCEICGFLTPRVSYKSQCIILCR